MGSLRRVVLVVVSSLALASVGTGPAQAAEPGPPVSEPPIVPAGDGVGPTVSFTYYPASTGQPAPVPAGGWFREPVGIFQTCADPDGVWNCSFSNRLYYEGETAAFSASDTFGASTSTSFVVPVDTTPPRIGVVNQLRAYRRDEVVDLGCLAADDRSGLAWVDNPCPSGVPASEFPPGDHRFVVRAVDRAGNETVAVAAFHRLGEAVTTCDPPSTKRVGRRVVSVPGACRTVVK